eukprot:1140344-Pelagomonas_calceolata.AAC.14
MELDTGGRQACPGKQKLTPKEALKPTHATKLSGKAGQSSARQRILGKPQCNTDLEQALAMLEAQDE